MRKILVIITLLSCTLISSAQNYRTVSDILYRNKGCDAYQKERCRLDVYYPEGLTDFPTIIWFHGGGLTAGNKAIPEQLKNQKFAIVAVNYRFASKVKVADCIDDAAAAVSWVVCNIKNYGGSTSKITVAGHSAGAFLTSMVGLDKRWLKPYSLNPDSLMALAPFSGNAFCHIMSRKEKGLPTNCSIADDMSPIYHVRADAPPMIFISADRNMEFMGRYEEIAAFWRQMKECGHKQCYIYEMQGYDHGGMAAPGFPIMLRHLRDILKNREIH